MLIEIDTGVVLNLERVIAAGPANSAPIRRLLNEVGRGQVVDLTLGRRRQAAVVMDSGHVVLLAVSPTALAAAPEHSKRIEAGAGPRSRAERR